MPFFTLYPALFSQIPMTVIARKALEDLPPLIVGGATFNTQYNEHPDTMPIASLLSAAFTAGFNALDTSPYYGPSEVLIGQALKHIPFQRDDYYICTKVGRIQLDDFDYSPEWVEKSIHRSLERLNTGYLDVVFLHDVEFQTMDQAFGALIKLKELQGKGLISYVGISGYPVDYLYRLAFACKNHEKIGSLDIIMSYSNFCLQNVTLGDYYDKFIDECGVKMVNNASILSMSLLTQQETKSFHPAPSELKQTVADLSLALKEKFDTDIAVLGTRFAIRNWTKLGKGRTVLGLSNLYELEVAIEQWASIQNETQDAVDEDEKLIKFCQDFLADHLNETWASGIDH